MIHGLPHRSLVVVVEFGRKTWENTTYGDAKLKKAKYCFTVGIGSTVMGNKKYVTTFAMSELWDRLHRFDCDDKRASCLAKFCNRNGGEQDATYMFFEFQDISYPERKNGILGFLAKTARSFHRELC